MPNTTTARNEVDNFHPLCHMGEPDDIAWGVVYLASDESKFITGAELVFGDSMKYQDGLEIRLGDIVSVPTPDGDRQARVVMLGDTQEHLKVDADFIAWVLRENILATTLIFVELLGSNPFTHSDPHLAPVGEFMSTTVDEHVHFNSRAVA